MNALSSSDGGGGRARPGLVETELFARQANDKLINAGPVHNRRGTSIRFKPDPTDFRQRRVQSVAALSAVPLKGLFVPRRANPLGVRRVPAAGPKDDTPAEAVLHFPGGLRDSLEAEIGEASGCCRNRGQAKPTSKRWCRPDGMGRRLAGGRRGVCPLVLQHDSDHAGGHARGRVSRCTAERAARLGRAARQSARRQVAAEDLLGPIAAKLSVFLRDPQFQGQTKEKLTSTEAARLVETALRDRFDHWLAGDPTQADNLLAFVIERAEERLRRRGE